MLDFDLALLYQVETRSLNQAIKRNNKPISCSGLTPDEYETIRFSSRPIYKEMGHLKKIKCSNCPLLLTRSQKRSYCC